MARAPASSVPPGSPTTCGPRRRYDVAGLPGHTYAQLGLLPQPVKARHVGAVRHGVRRAGPLGRPADPRRRRLPPWRRRRTARSRCAPATSWSGPRWTSRASGGCRSTRRRNSRVSPSSPARCRRGTRSRSWRRHRRTPPRRTRAPARATARQPPPRKPPPARKPRTRGDALVGVRPGGVGAGPAGVPGGRAGHADAAPPPQAYGRHPGRTGSPVRGIRPWRR